jgi:hypothetical protein
MDLFLKAGIPLNLSAKSFGRIPASVSARMASDSLSRTFQSERAEKKLFAWDGNRLNVFYLPAYII